MDVYMYTMQYNIIRTTNAVATAETDEEGVFMW